MQTLNVNTAQVAKLVKRLERKGFRYCFPLAPVTPATEMIRHYFTNDATHEHCVLNERKNGYHNITNG